LGVGLNLAFFKRVKERPQIEKGGLMQNPFDFNSLPNTPAYSPLVMLVEGPEDGELVKLILEQTGIAVLHCISEEELAEAVASATPDLLLVGWDDRFDGLGMVSRLKQGHPALRSIPIVLMAGCRVDGQQRRRLCDLGVKWILEKPIVATSLPKLVAATIRQKSSQVISLRDLMPSRITLGQTASAAIHHAVS
jgi:DNA-binding response OmpR family regulator